MKLAIMQPYFLPYIGYWQLINAVDVFVIYDNIQYTKKGWFNRNRFLQNGKDALFSIPLKKDSDFLDVDKRVIAPEFDKVRLLNQFKHAYIKSPNFKEVFQLLSDIINNDEENLFKYIHNSVLKICDYLKINTKIVISSSIEIDHTLKSEKKVLEICKSMNAQIYINTIGGIELYDKSEFSSNGIDLKFIKSNYIEYIQFENGFVPWLSIIDVMMFNTKDVIKQMIFNYELL